MIQAIIQKIGAAIIAGIMSILGIVMPAQVGDPFGAFNPTGGQRYQLASPITSSATSITLASLKYPVNDLNIAMTDIGEIGYATIEPGSSTKIEFISFTGITQNSVGTATLTGVSRGLDFKSPYSASTTLASAHSGGSRVIFSNSPGFYSEFALLKNDETITGTWTFDDAAMPALDAYTAPTSDTEFATKKYADDLTNQGAATGTTGTAGIFELAERNEMGSSTATGGSNYSLVLHSGFATTSCQVATSSVVVTRPSGKIQQACLDLTETYTWTAAHTFSSATTTFASSTFNGFVHFIRNIEIDNNLQVDGHATTTGTHEVVENLNVAGRIDIDGANSLMASTTFEGNVLFNQVPYAEADPTDGDQLARKSYIDGMSPHTYTTTASTTVSNTTTKTNYLSTTVSANYLGTDKSVRVTAYFWNWDRNNGENDDLTFAFTYGGTTIASVKFDDTTTAHSDFTGKVEILLTAAGATNAQKGTIMVTAIQDNNDGPVNTDDVVALLDIGWGEVDSTSDQTLTASVQWSSADASNTITITQVLVETIR